MSTAVNAFLDTVRQAHSTQQLIETVLRTGTPSRMVCPTCGRETRHHDKRIDGVVYTVCRNCHSLTTSA